MPHACRASNGLCAQRQWLPTLVGRVRNSPLQPKAQAPLNTRQLLTVELPSSAHPPRAHGAVPVASSVVGLAHAGLPRDAVRLLAPSGAQIRWGPGRGAGSGPMGLLRRWGSNRQAFWFWGSMCATPRRAPLLLRTDDPLPTYVAIPAFRPTRSQWPPLQRPMVKLRSRHPTNQPPAPTNQPTNQPPQPTNQPPQPPQPTTQPPNHP